ncbi:hypothetical protein SUDANB54_00010 [Streptomyces sp. enrichment culture]
MERLAPGLSVVSYPTPPPGSAAACYPKTTNVLVPLDSVADTSNTPRLRVSSCVRSL